MELNHQPLLKKVLPKRIWNFIHDSLFKKIEPDLFLINPYLNYSFSQEGEDLILHRLIGEKSKGFYIDIGAHHPIQYSNTYKFYKRGWSGINVDPLPGSMNLFNRYRSRDINIEIGISSDENNKIKYYMFSEPVYNTLSFERLKEIEQFGYSKFIGEKEISTISLKTLCNKYIDNNQIIDFMTIDVEGMDLDVLQSNDWTLYRPRFLVVESLYTKLSDINALPTHQFMVEKNYELVAKAMHSLIYFDTTNEILQ